MPSLSQAVEARRSSRIGSIEKEVADQAMQSRIQSGHLRSLVDDLERLHTRVSDGVAPTPGLSGHATLRAHSIHP